MLRVLRHLGPRRVALAAMLATVAGATIPIVGVDADEAVTSTAAGPLSGSCGPATASTIAAVDAVAARLIYAGELHGTETRADIGHITGSTALLRGLAEQDQAAVQLAVHALVYAPRWHIVRLRVTGAGRVLSDIGGPEIIAPVSGPLSWHGKTVGHYVMSVQDDVGYVKLETRFVGVPVELYRNGARLMGTLNPAPATVGNGAVISVAGRAFQTRVLNMSAFPAGSLQVALMIPRPSATTARQSCPAIRLAAWGSIAEHTAVRFRPLASHYRDLVSVLRATTGFRAYVTSGVRRIAGGAGPARLPAAGNVRFAGKIWSVFSWSPEAGVRVYLLTPSG
jgi:hypothetical protein